MITLFYKPFLKSKQIDSEKRMIKEIVISPLIRKSASDSLSLMTNMRKIENNPQIINFPYLQKSACFEPEKTPCTESRVIEIARKGAIDANSFAIVGLLLKSPAQMLWPNARARTTRRARRTESLRVTAIAFLALSGLPSPNSFDTLVLLHEVINFNI